MEHARSLAVTARLQYLIYLKLIERIMDGDKQIIGVQPIYATNSQGTKGAGNVVQGMLAGVALIAIVFSGTVLWGKASKTDEQIEQVKLEAVQSERRRFQECVTGIPQDHKTEDEETVRPKQRIANY